MPLTSLVARLAEVQGASLELEGGIPLRAILDVVPDGLLVVADDGGILAANTEAERLFGYCRGELDGLSVEQLVPMRLRPGHAELRAGYARQPRVRDMQAGRELPARRADGSELRVEVRLGPVTRDAAWVVATVRDAGARRAATAEQRRRDEHLRLLLDQVPAVVWTTDRSLRHASTVGDAATRAGLGTAEASRLTAPHAFPSGHPHMEAHLRALEGEHARYELQLGDRTLAVRLEPLHDLDDTVTGVVGVATDVTDALATEAEARQAAERVAALVEAAPGAVVAVDAAGRVTHWNPAAEELFGIASAAAVGQDAVVLLGGEGSPLRDVLERVLAGQGVPASEVTVAASGRAAPHELSVAGAPLGRGREGGGMLLLTDVSPRLRLEARLRQAEKMEAVGRLTAGLTHDLNNVLTVIAGYGALLGRTPLASAHAEEVGEIVRACERAAELTGRLLRFGGRGPFKWGEVSLDDVVAGLVPMLRRLVGSQIRLHVLGGEGLPPMRGDVGRLEQVVVNLVANARDAMPGGGDLTIATRADGGHVHLSVADTGCGIDPAVRDSLFEPFVTTKGPDHGNGLGLATVSGIVGDLGGAIEVESRPGEGTIFRLSFPAAAADSLSESLAPPAGAQRIALLVAPDEMVLGLLARLAADDGFHVRRAHDGAEALRHARALAWAVDVLVVDTGTSEVDAAGLITEFEVAGSRPATVLLGEASGFAVARAAPGGAVRLQKPFTPAALAEAIGLAEAGRRSSP